MADASAPDEATSEPGNDEVSSDAEGPTPEAPVEARPTVVAAVDSEPAPRELAFTPGAQVFLRAEGRINPDFSSADNTAPDRARVLQRARLQLMATWGPVAAFVQAQDARSWGFETSTISNEANTDLHQGWLEVAGSKNSRELRGSIRAGRQEIVWGSQRMIGSLLWLPGARSFDALRLQGRAGPVSAELFVSMLAPPSTFDVPDPDPAFPPATVQTRGQQLAAAMVTYTAVPAINVEAMAITDFADASMAAPARDRRILDFGGRVWGTPVRGFRYEAEGHGQSGRDGALDHRAWAWAANVAYVYRNKAVKPGGTVGYAMASGSACTQTADVGCGDPLSRDFFNFYPTNHIHYGLVDLLGWRNMRDLEVTGRLEWKWMKAALGYHYLALHQSTGRWRNAGGALVGAGWDPGNQDNNLGHELDVVVTLNPWKPLMIQPGYGVFVPTGGGRVLGGDDAQQFLYLWLVATF